MTGADRALLQLAHLKARTERKMIAVLLVELALEHLDRGSLDDVEVGCVLREVFGYDPRQAA